MKKGTEQNIFEFLQSNPSTFVAADLERKIFLNRNGNPSSPKSIRNRLQDLARDGKINVEEIGGFAYYSIKEEQRKKVRTYVPVIENGRQVAVREVVTLV